MANDLQNFSAESADPLPPSLIFAPELDWNDVQTALDNGVTSYLLQSNYSFWLDEVLLCTARGVSMFDPEIKNGRPGKPFRTGTEQMIAASGLLSGRERQVIELLAAGQAVRDIASDLFLTERTVRNYISRIYGKLGVRSRSEAILTWLGHLDA
ncbi:response regulator transcription factor [Streptomyces sp. NPDC004539]|uniref:helix-turn-helix domain-containing protein n=1 Tax=Streptomyces sp. NPDC004539 TaxID=3154280 RepID=UPI0033B67103